MLEQQIHWVMLWKLLISGEFLTPLPLSSIASPTWNPKSHSSQKAVSSEALQSPSAIPITSVEQGHHGDKHIPRHIYDFRKTSSAELWFAFHLNRKTKLTLWVLLPIPLCSGCGNYSFSSPALWTLCSLGRICNVRLKDQLGSPELQAVFNRNVSIKVLLIERHRELNQWFLSILACGCAVIFGLIPDGKQGSTGSAGTMAGRVTGKAQLILQNWKWGAAQSRDSDLGLDAMGLFYC